MSKARLIITAVVVEGRSQREVARAYGVNRWVSRLVARYRAEGAVVRTAPAALPAVGQPGPTGRSSGGR
jgi:transposase